MTILKVISAFFIALPAITRNSMETPKSHQIFNFWKITLYNLTFNHENHPATANSWYVQFFVIFTINTDVFLIQCVNIYDMANNKSHIFECNFNLSHWYKHVRWLYEESGRDRVSNMCVYCLSPSHTIQTGYDPILKVFAIAIWYKHLNLLSHSDQGSA